jgi:serine/threonine protein kinase
MNRLKPLQILKNYGATQISLLKDLEQGRFLVEKKIIVSIDVQKKLFANEIAVHSQLSHRYIIKFLKQTNSESFLMEYAPGGSIEQMLQKDPAAVLSKRQVHQLVKGIAYLHELGYVHNDIKTSNILLDADKRVKITDFAFAGKIGETFFGDFPDYFMVGTDRYRPGFKKRSMANYIQNDLYSIGIVLYNIFAKDRDHKPLSVKCIEDKTIRHIVQCCIDESFETTSEILEVLAAWD